MDAGYLALGKLILADKIKALNEGNSSFCLGDSPYYKALDTLAKTHPDHALMDQSALEMRKIELDAVSACMLQLIFGAKE